MSGWHVISHADFFVRCLSFHRIKTKVSGDSKDLKILLYSISRLSKIYFTRSSVKWSYPSMYQVEEITTKFLKKNKKLEYGIEVNIEINSDPELLVTVHENNIWKGHLKKENTPSKINLILNSVHCNQRKNRNNFIIYSLLSFKLCISCSYAEVLFFSF